MFATAVTVVHVLVALALIVIVLFQRGKGAAMGAAFGGSSQTLFGSRGPAGPLAKMTTAAAIIFMLTAITLSVISNKGTGRSVVSDVKASDTLPVTLPEQKSVEQTSHKVPSTGPISQSKENSHAGPVGPVETGEQDNSPVPAK